MHILAWVIHGDEVRKESGYLRCSLFRGQCMDRQQQPSQVVILAEQVTQWHVQGGRNQLQDWQR